MIYTDDLLTLAAKAPPQTRDGGTPGGLPAAELRNLPQLLALAAAGRPPAHKLALADDSTADDSSGDSTKPVVPVVIDDESQRRLGSDEREPRPPTVVYS